MLLTGRLGRRTGIGRTVIDDGGFELRGRELGLAELLHEAPVPYTSAMFGKWHLGSADEASNAEHPRGFGFDRWAITRGNLPDYFAWTELRDDGIGAREGYVTSAVVDDALAFAAETPTPWLSIVAFHAAHTPLHAPPDALVATPVGAGAPRGARFRAMIEAADTEIGRLLAGLPEPTVVVMLGDNGTLGEFALPPFDPAGGKLTLDEGGVRVPLVVAGPGIAPGVAEGLVHVVDLWPTLAGLADVALDDVADLPTLDGYDLRPLLDDPAATVRDAVYTESFAPNGLDAAGRVEDRIAVRDDRWRYHLDRLTGRERLSDVAAQDDVADGPNLLAGGATPAPDAAEALDRLRAEARAWEDRLATGR
jgi:arylsulfatase A-like enzyme